MRVQNNKERNLGVIGKIKVGELVKRNEKTFPSSLDYFRATSDVSRYVDIFDDLFPKKNLLPVVFGGNDDAFNTNHRYEIRDSTGRVYAYGDGVDYYISVFKGFKKFDSEMLISKYGSIEDFLSKTASYLTTGRVKAEWREVLTLRFVIASMPILGAWELRTAASKSSIDQILGNYDLAKSINGGNIKGVPFFLRVKKVKSNRVLERQRVYPVISLDQILTDTAKSSELLNGSDLKLLG